MGKTELSKLIALATIKDLRNLLLNILNEGAVFSAESRQFQICTPQIRILEARMLVLCLMRRRLQCCLVQWEWISLLVINKLLKCLSQWQWQWQCLLHQSIKDKDTNTSNNKEQSVTLFIDSLREIM